MALLVALFTLVLLSVVGLGLMYSTNMESVINANFRDKQIAMYGAMSGVQEARDRLQPAAPKVTLPADVPTLTNHQVIYIINPSGSETVAPWDSTNPYMDTELCQEGILGLTPTPGIPSDTPACPGVVVRTSHASPDRVRRTSTTSPSATRWCGAA